MYSKAATAYAFNRQSFYRQPTMNLRPVQQAVSNGYPYGQQSPAVTFSPLSPTANSAPLFQQTHPNYSLQLSLNQFDSEPMTAQESMSSLTSSLKTPPNTNHSSANPKVGSAERRKYR